MQPDPSSRRPSLPEPDAAGAAHSARVADSTRRLIDAAGGSISFGEFMQHLLYAPGLGYYVAGSRKFGPDGDFVTAPEVSSLFGAVIARQIAPVLAARADAGILEFGAGSGALALQVLRRLRELDCLPRRYLVLEVSADLRERQQQLLAREEPALAARIEWTDAVPDGFAGVVLANEVLDAMPVERFRIGEDGDVQQLRVVNEGDGFGWSQALAPAWLGDRVAALAADLPQPLPAGYVSELSPGLPGWIGDLAARLSDALVLLFDYGVSRREYYAPDRHDGFLRCHFRHRAHNDPFLWPGIQDLTAWVDFTAVAEAAVDNGLDVAAYVTQSQFLLHGGLAEELLLALGDAPGSAGNREPAADAAARYELSRQVKLLTLPGEMGEHFKCMGLAAGDVSLPVALIAADRSHTL